MIEKYRAIIDLPHHRSDKHPHMSMSDRACQFAPFAALNGYEEAVEETARLTDFEIDLDDNYLNEMDRVIRYIRDHIKERPVVTITYFVPDKLKDGGEYKTVIDSAVKLDDIEKTVTLSSGKVISVDSVYGISLG